MVSTIAGYQMIANNLDRSPQRTAEKPDVQRDTTYCLAHIGDVKTVDQFINKLKTFLQRFSAMWEGENGQAMSTTATPSILVDQPIELGINAATLTSLQNLKIGR